MIRLNGELPFFLKVDGLQHQQRVLKSSFLYKSFEASEKRGETKLIFKIEILTHDLFEFSTQCPIN